MKYETYSQYNPAGVGTAESAFLTVWAGLGSWHSDLVLIGGLVPKYLCGDLSAPRTLPRPVTLAELRTRPGLADFPLVRLPRLSVMPVTAREWKEIERLAKTP